ncbi:hypothetical protein SCA6_003245 [Theobroma cacao]
MMAERELDPKAPPGLHLFSAFLAMETTDTLLSLASLALFGRECGGGKITDEVQTFICNECLDFSIGKGNEYMKKFLKKIITEVESRNGYVSDDLYEEYVPYMTSSKDFNLFKETGRILKCISFLFHADCVELSSCPSSRNLVVELQCSLNMLEGDTGCSIWPSCLFLSELILSFPHIFLGKSCFEVGSGVGLVGICLAYVKASKVILSDGDLSTLANMKFNLEMNHINTETDLPETSTENPKLVKCIHLPWESASEKELQEFMPEIILGADVIYDPSCLPHLIRVLAILLSKKKSCDKNQKGSFRNSSTEVTCADGKANSSSQGQVLNAHGSDSSSSHAYDISITGVNNAASLGSRADPVAYIASVIRNIDTFNHFLALADQANLTISDLTSTLRPLDLLPYMRSYDRSSIRLFTPYLTEMGDQKQEEIEVIHSWSAPRSLSTSLMYSFAQRDDIEVLDEPLYGTFLNVTGVERPYREELLSKMECDGNKVVKEIIYGPGGKKYRFCKHIAKQRVPGLPIDLLQKGKHFILIRNPVAVLPSFDKVVPPSILELGLGELVSIYSELCALGKPPPVIDAADLQQNPEATLRGLCEDLNIPFQNAMLRHVETFFKLKLLNPFTGSSCSASYLTSSFMAVLMSCSNDGLV